MSKQFGRQSYSSVPSLTVLHNICTSQSSVGLQEKAPLPPQSQFDKRVTILPRCIDIPELREVTSSESNEGEYKETHNINALKLHFFKHIRPFLVSRCLLLTRPLHDRWVESLHLMNSNLTGYMPCLCNFTGATEMSQQVAVNLLDTSVEHACDRQGCGSGRLGALPSTNRVDAL